MENSIIETFKKAFQQVLRIYLLPIADSRGFSTLTVIGVVGVISLGGLRLILNKNGQILRESARTIVTDKVQSEMQKLLSVAGFLISNNYIRCKESTKHCSTDPQADFRKFGLYGLKGDENGLHFTNVDMDFINPEVLSQNRTKILSASLSFKLMDTRSNYELNRLMGERNKEVQQLDRDYSVVLATARIQFEIKDRTFLAERHYTIRRPLGIIKVEIETGQCSSRCETASSQNPFPSCAGPQTLDPNSVVNVTGRVQNLGPGTIYELRFRREVCLRRTMGSPLDKNSNCDKLADSYIELPVKILAPKAYINFSDTIPCKTFENIVQSNNTTNSVKYQHIASGGRVSYVLDAQDTETKIDPFRQNENIIGNDVSLPGRVGTIFVVPPH